MSNGKPKVLVLGGGFGGTETATYLAASVGEAAEITVVSKEDDFLFRPNTIYIPFGLDVKKLMFPLAPALGKKGIHFSPGTAREVNPDSKTVTVEGYHGGFESLPYDYLVIATGAGMRPSDVPGMEQFAHNPWTPAEMSRLGEGFRGLVERGKAGERTTAVFLVPPNNKCSGPLYELVFMLDTWLRSQKARDWVTISWTTFEKTFIQAFGPKMHPYMVDDFARRGIDAHNEWVVERERGGLVYGRGEVIVGVGIPVTRNLQLRYRQRVPGLAHGYGSAGAPATPFERDVEAEYRLSRFFFVTTEVTQRRILSGSASQTVGAPDLNINLKARWEY